MEEGSSMIGVNYPIRYIFPKEDQVRTEEVTKIRNRRGSKNIIKTND